MSTIKGTEVPTKNFDRLAPRPEGIYAITPDNWPLSGLLDCVEAALEAGVTWVQYRDKQRSEEDRILYGCGLSRLVRFYEGHLVINDSLPVCRELIKTGYPPSGIHLGKNDGDIREARAALGANAVVGASCYDDFERAAMAVKYGASYVAFGSLFRSRSKPGATSAPLSLVHQTQLALRIPVVGIGGIDSVNVIRVAESGACAAATITAVFGTQPDPAYTFRVASQLVENFQHGVRLRGESVKA
jgi:thiamine-phosphate pyrophosphorylase